MKYWYAEWKLPLPLSAGIKQHFLNTQLNVSCFVCFQPHLEKRSLSILGKRESLKNWWEEEKQWEFPVFNFFKKKPSTTWSTFLVRPGLEEPSWGHQESACIICWDSRAHINYKFTDPSRRLHRITERSFRKPWKHYSRIWNSLK